MTTYEEVITWHPYPEEKPKYWQWYLIHESDGDVDVIWGCIPIEWGLVIAWAEMPKGMRSNGTSNS